MAVDKFVDSYQLNSDLTSVANAIRTKGGTSSQLAFPSGFITALDNISGGWVKTLSAVFTQSTTRVFTTDELDDLRDRLTVTATYEDNTSEVVTDYTLSGTLTAGTSTIIVNYGDKSTSFTATVTAAADVTPAISAWTNAGASQVVVVTNATDKTVLIYLTSSAAYKNASANMTFDEGYNYRISADYEYFAGRGRIGLVNSSESIMFGTPSTAATSSGHFVADGIPSESANFTSSGFFRLYVTYGTKEAGRCVYSNIKCIKYSTATPEQTLNALLGGETI